ncbi:heterokaryon incompatibility protein-domain-containing protein [Pisolithus croceorrhizus]|nr:heterokaryon incompatibility protein-domain-containing protein [Pisolithus croceorrhizus]
MKLLDVKAVLDRESDIQQTDPEREILKGLDDEGTHYAILSHRWGAEVSYKEMTGLMKMAERKRDEVRQRAGYQKIIESCKQAMKDGYEWLWIDTCCIDKRSSSELSEAINSMYRWYQNAQVCYAYLNDVSESTFPTKQDDNKFDKSNGWPEWFVRGWTLQELIAPKQVKFFNKDWVHIGDKQRFAPTLERTTGIPRGVLTSGLAGKRLSVAQIMSWAAERKTTRVEDRAYSLMGLFGVNMPMLYGEGKKAFQRLQLEIIREFTDQSIFAWNPRMPRTGSVLAEDPSDFRGCGDIERVEPDKFVYRLREEYSKWGYSNKSSRRDIDRLVVLRDKVEFQQFTVSNAGIQVLLLVVPSCDSPSHFRAILACTHGQGLIAIDLVSFGRSFARTSIDSLLPATYPDLQTVHLIHHQDANETRRELVLDDQYTSYHGFTRRGTYPREFTRNTVTLSSLAEDLIVIVYANNGARSCFAIGLGYYFGQGWVQVEYDGRSATQEENWTDFGKTAYRRMWRARAKHAQTMPKRQGLYSGEFGNRFVRHAHLPRSIWAARVVWGRWEEDDFTVMVDVVECPGCCDGQCRTTITSHDRYGLTMPGLMTTVSRSYSLELDGQLAWADKCSGQRIAVSHVKYPYVYLGLHIRSWVTMVTTSGAILYALEIYLRICRPLALISGTNQLMAPRSPAHLVEALEY